ncbi:MAG: FAD:protein FMN transferase [Phycisphaerales bacterium]
MMAWYRIRIARAPALALVLLLMLPACAPLVRHQFTRVCMGVRTDIITYAPSAAKAESAAAAAFDRIAEIEQVLSDYRPTSEASRLSARAGGEPTPVSADMLRVLIESSRISAATDGAFDVTVGPLVLLWREARRLGQLPDPAALAAARQLVDWRSIEIDERAGTVRLVRPGMRLDFGGIGKGYAASEALVVMRGHGCARTLVALAGDIAVGAPPPRRAGWSIAVGGMSEPLAAADAATATSARGSPPADDAHFADDPMLTLVLLDAAVSTSGDESQFIIIDGRRYSHIVDPRTGLGTTGGLAVTVISPRGEWSDALSTALCVLGEAGAETVAAFGPSIAVMFREAARTRLVDPSSMVRWKEP